MSKLKSLSKSSILAFEKCPFYFYCRYLLNIQEKINYNQVFGIAIHRFISGLYRKTKEERSFFYKTQESAIKAWCFLWRKDLNDFYQKGLIKSEKEENNFLRRGIKYLKSYWNNNLHIKPLEVEKRFSGFILGLKIEGVIDQLREIPLRIAQGIRPDFKPDNFDLKVIIDLKTEYPSLDGKETDSLIQKIQRQVNYHQDLEPAIYLYLYEQVNQKKCFSFGKYFLANGRIYYTWRDNYDFLYRVVENILECTRKEEFPKNKGKFCELCSYFDVCNQNKKFIYSPPQEPNFSSKNEVQRVKIPPKKKIKGAIQLKIKFPKEKKQK